MCVLVLAAPLDLGALSGVVSLGDPEPDRLDDELVHVLGGDDPGEPGPGGLDEAAVGLVEPREKVQLCHPLLFFSRL